MHRCASPRTQWKQSPQFGTKLMITRAPGFTLLTPSPTVSTKPAPSWPSTTGVGIGMVPFTTDRSEWHTPQAAILIPTSPAFGGSMLTFSTEILFSS